MTYDVDHEKHTHRWANCKDCAWTFDPERPTTVPFVHTQQTGHRTYGVSTTTESYEPSETNFPLKTDAK